MADRRSVRASSRRTTPILTARDNEITVQPARALRARSLRSASRDIDSTVDVLKPTRRSARQASVTSAMLDSEPDGKTAHKKKPRSAKNPARDLATVQELSTPITSEQQVFDDLPGTPVQLSPEITIPFHSPGALSEMSGTTAISSFSMVEAECLESKYILKHLRKLHDSVEEFLDYLTPDNADIQDDLRNITELQKPDSDFTEDYRDYDVELNVHLRHYKSEENTYIHIRALHRTLFGPNGHDVAEKTGVDSVLYLTNLLVFVKQMIYSDRNSKASWDTLRQLDNSFPNQFMAAFIPAASPTVAGQSGLLSETFELALELRTQLAIMVLGRQTDYRDSSKDIEEVFVRSGVSQAADDSTVRGWSIPGLDPEEATLPREFQTRITRRCEEMTALMAMGNTQRDEIISILEQRFPWEPTILRLLHWVRLRHHELKAVIYNLGGALEIVRNIQRVMEKPEAVANGAKPTNIAPLQQQKKRQSFGRDGRRSIRRFDPTAPVDLSVIDALKSRERLSGAQSDVELLPHKNDSQPLTTNGPVNFSAMEPQQDDWQPVQMEEPLIQQEQDGLLDDAVESDENATLVAESQPHLRDKEIRLPGQQRIARQQRIAKQQVQAEKPVTEGPPKSTAELLMALKSVSNPGKENRPLGLFERHANAQRVEFGTGFNDSSPRPGASNIDKGKKPAQPSPQKRPRPIESEEDSEDDGFETIERGSRVQEQRRKAPAAKRVRVEPSASSGYQPPSYQTRDSDSVASRPERYQEQRVSVDESPDATNAPRSTYQSQYDLVRQNRRFQNSQRERKPREAWTPKEEETFIQYMAKFPTKYALILEYDGQHNRVLQERTQVNLKDKARNMAINMIKSGTGPSVGFEGIVKPTTKEGRNLIDMGYSW